MLQSLVDNIVCEICGGALVFSKGNTFVDYNELLSFKCESLIDSVDNIIGKHLVFECSSCLARISLRYKDIEKRIRIDITQRVLALMASENFKKNYDFASKNNYFVFCDKCEGFDGTGCCPASIYSKCELKRFPII